MASPYLEDLRSRTADLRGIADVRLVALEDGPGRGKRLLFCRNGCGLEFEISVDKGFDVSALRWRGLNLGWNSPVGGGVPAIDLEAEDGLGLLRSFDGFMVTCGLDHYGAPSVGAASHFNYPLRSHIHRPLHGRISSVPATLRGYGIDLAGKEPRIWCEAVLRQATLFAEVLELRRRIEMPLFEPLIRIKDRVTNIGWQATRHATLYHFNLGFPLVDGRSVLTGSFGKDVVAEFAAAPPVAKRDAVETFELNRSSANSAGWAHAGLFNPTLDRGVKLEVAYSADTLPELGLWRAYQSGVYAVGLEPCSGITTDEGYQGPGTPHYLEPGEIRRYEFEICVGEENLLGQT